MMVYSTELALFAQDDCEEVITRLTETLRDWDAGMTGERCRPSGGLTQARQRLGPEPLYRADAGVVLGAVAADVHRQMEWDVPDTASNAAAFRYSGADGQQKAAFLKARVVTVSECASHAAAAAAIGVVTAGKGTAEQGLARQLYPRNWSRGGC